METLDVRFLMAGDPPLYRPGEIDVIEVDDAFTLIGLEAGMTSGKPSVMFDIPLPDGRHVVAQTSYALLGAAMAALRGRFGESNV